jgi:hypothetical protein
MCREEKLLMITGYTKYKEQQYIFTYENELLSLIPPDKETLNKCRIGLLSSFNKERDHENNNQIWGITTHGKSICFIIYNGASNDNGVLNLTPSVVYEFNGKDTTIEEISFYGDEVNLFYNPSNSYNAVIQEDSIESGCLSIETRPYTECSKTFSFQYGDETIRADLSVLRNLQLFSQTPLKFESCFTFSFVSSKNIKEINEFYNTVLNFFYFICYRKNISFNKIQLMKNTSNGKRITIGTVTVLNDYPILKEHDKKSENRIIDFNIIDKICGDIFTSIKQQNIYFTHIPKSTEDQSYITTASFILACAAFEWEFKQLYGEIKSKENKIFKEVKDNECLETISQKSSRHKGYTRKYSSFIEKSDMSLSERIRKTLKEFNFMDIFFVKLFCMNSESKQEYQNMPERLQTQRNNYAHGNIDKELNPLVVLDVICLEWIVYALVLKRHNMENNSINQAINKLFNRGFAL